MLPAALTPLLNALRRDPDVHRVILFGSRARGDSSSRSDMDLAIDAPRLDRRRWLELLDLAEEAPTLLPIDLILLHAAPAALQRRIAAEGVTLYDSQRSAA